MTTTKATKGSGGNGGSGAAAARLRPPIASTTPPAPSPEDRDRLMTREEVYDFLRLEGGERRLEAIEGLPVVVVGTAERYLREQLITWAALGGTRPRHARNTRAARRSEA